jgi:hypothetical protein
MQRSTHTTLRGVLAALGTTAVVAAALTTGTAIASPSASIKAQPKAQAAAGCPSGDVCIYPGDGDSGDPDTYYTYGAHNLSNQYGTHLIVNNQTGGATFRLCTGYNGARCGDPKGPGSYHENLTPINSITLEP